jgi:hypothetical protein
MQEENLRAVEDLGAGVSARVCRLFPGLETSASVRAGGTRLHF